jgi:hydroxysqualene synthase
VVSASAAATSPAVLRRAYDACTELARAHYENFPVASLLLPRRMRPAIAAVYAFARRADDFADEPGYTQPERLRLLDDWQRRLEAAAAGTVSAGTANDLIFVAVADAIREHDLPVSLFSDLLSAFRQDVTTSRYERWVDVLDYCSRSANPVGRLVLRIAGHRDDALDRSSDALCTALQLTNFWQDLAIDWSRGRLYVPEEIWRAHHADVESLDARIMTTQWKAALADCGVRTRELFERGRPVCDGVSGRLRYELRATWLGGTRILDRLDRAGYDVFRARPKLGASDALVIACETLLWRETRPSPTRS